MVLALEPAGVAVRLPGTCEKCHRHTRVKVGSHAAIMAHHTGRPLAGLCSECEEWEDLSRIARGLGFVVRLVVGDGRVRVAARAVVDVEARTIEVSAWVPVGERSRLLRGALVSARKR